MNICYQCKRDNHESCEEILWSDALGKMLCSCEVRKHALKTYLIKATLVFAIQEFSPSNAKSIVSDLLERNGNLPAVNLKVVSPLERDPCNCTHLYDNHKRAIEGGDLICTICPCSLYDDE